MATTSGRAGAPDSARLQDSAAISGGNPSGWVGLGFAPISSSVRMNATGL
jgi:hypothetical protein